MKKFSMNLQARLVLAIVLLGIIGAATTFISTRVYRELTFDYQRQYLTQLIELKVADTLTGLEAQSTQLGLHIQGREGFPEAFDSQDFDLLSRELWQQFNQGLVTANVVNAVKLYAFDINFALLGSATRLMVEMEPHTIVCSGLLDRARNRTGADRLQSITELCLFEDKPYFAVMVPLGGLRPYGYLQVVSDPVPGLSRISESLDIPIQISLMNDAAVYQTPDWATDSQSKSILSEYILKTSLGMPALRIAVARNANALLKHLDQTDMRLLLLVISLIVLTVIAALALIKYSVLDPLKNLSNQLRARSLTGPSLVPPAGTAGPDETPSFHALSELYETLHDMAIRDPLTGLYNRALFEDRLKQLIAESRRIDHKAAILMLDMVRFKYVNDVLGHHAGDMLLKEVVSRLQGVLRESDTLARLGGDEFTIILPDADGDQAILVAQKILQVLEPEFEIGGHTLTASMSIGISLYPDHGENAETILRHADFAMYTAKKNAPGYALYNPQATDRMRAAELTMSGAIRRAIVGSELFMAYQPVFSIQDNQVAYLEALVRWRQPDGTVWTPESFIRVAEQSGLIKQLAEWVIDAVCRELSGWLSCQPDLRIGINLSMHNLHDNALPDYIDSVLHRYQLNSSSILIEITETGVMLDPDQVLETLDRLADMGLKLSIDDFGTGQSSLVYLKRLPVDALKVDKSFIQEMISDEDDAAIVHATIDLAHSLGLRVTAEGVETKQVYERLKTMGCDEYQGNYASKPLAADELFEWMKGDIQVRALSTGQ